MLKPKRSWAFHRCRAGSEPCSNRLNKQERRSTTSDAHKRKARYAVFDLRSESAAWLPAIAFACRWTARGRRHTSRGLPGLGAIGGPGQLHFAGFSRYRQNRLRADGCFGLQGCPSLSFGVLDDRLRTRERHARPGRSVGVVFVLRINPSRTIEAAFQNLGGWSHDRPHYPVEVLNRAAGIFRMARHMLGQRLLRPDQQA